MSMRWTRRVAAKLRVIFRGARAEDDRQREIATHLGMLEEEFLEQGLTPEEARRQAHLKLGNPTVIREEARRISGIAWLENLGRDIHYALRQFRRSPDFTVAAVLTLALGIGAAAAMFSVLDGVVLRPLPYKNPGQIVRIGPVAPAGYWQPASWPEYQDMRRLNTDFSVIAGMGYGGGVTLTQNGHAIYLHAVQGTDNFFQLLGFCLSWAEPACRGKIIPAGMTSSSSAMESGGRISGAERTLSVRRFIWTARPTPLSESCRLGFECCSMRRMWFTRRCI